jgi:hypothetical protein
MSLVERSVEAPRGVTNALALVTPRMLPRGSYVAWAEPGRTRNVESRTSNAERGMSTVERRPMYYGDPVMDEGGPMLRVPRPFEPDPGSADLWFEDEAPDRTAMDLRVPAPYDDDVRFADVREPGGARLDLDGDGIPDGAQVSFKRDLATGGSVSARWVKGADERPEAIHSDGERGARSAESGDQSGGGRPRERDYWRERGPTGMMRWQEDQAMARGFSGRDTNALRRATMIEGVRDRPNLRAYGLAQARAQYTEPAEIEGSAKRDVARTEAEWQDRRSEAMENQTREASAGRLAQERARGDWHEREQKLVNDGKLEVQRLIENGEYEQALERSRSFKTVAEIEVAADKLIAEAHEKGETERARILAEAKAKGMDPELVNRLTMMAASGNLRVATVLDRFFGKARAEKATTGTGKGTEGPGGAGGTRTGAGEEAYGSEEEARAAGKGRGMVVRIPVNGKLKRVRLK